jgi:hypothetical protein
LSRRNFSQLKLVLAEHSPLGAGRPSGYAGVVHQAKVISLLPKKSFMKLAFQPQALKPGVEWYPFRQSFEPSS